MGRLRRRPRCDLPSGGVGRVARVKAFVTGGHGFVGSWLVQHLTAAGDEVVAPHADEVDITDAAVIRTAIADAAPDAVYHLAAFTHVGDSWNEPAKAFEANVTGTLRLLEAARSAASRPTVLVVSSSEVYGRVAAEQLPITEDAPLRPVTPYAASKAAAEMAAVQAHLGYDQPVIVVRPFNHVGPGQSPSFVVSALARNVAEAERKGTATVRVGNLSPRRDFTDVRDVVAAYRALVLSGEPGQIYHICSGRDVAISEIADRLLDLSESDLRLDVDPTLFRPVDVPEVRGDPGRIESATGWRPAIPLEQTLADTLAYWRTELA